MTDCRFDVLCIGNAIVDVLSRMDDAFLESEGLVKGSMNLIDTERAETLYAKIGPAIEASGGSAGNTAAGVAALGRSSAFFGKVAQDTLGDIYSHDLKAQGVHFETPRLQDGTPTARSMILITPDGERTMNTYLGACVKLGPDDIEEDVVAGAAVTYFEGYLWDPPLAKDAMRKAAEIAHRNGREMAITLSDSFCVDRWRPEFLDLIRTKTVDLVFANEAELLSLYEVTDFDEALTALKADCSFAAVTRGAEGSVILKDGDHVAVDAFPVDRVVDATGAGDLYATGFLAGYRAGLDLGDAGRLGSLCASEVLQHIGPRPQSELLQRAREEGFGL